MPQPERTLERDFMQRLDREDALRRANRPRRRLALFAAMLVAVLFGVFATSTVRLFMEKGRLAEMVDAYLSEATPL